MSFAAAAAKSLSCVRLFATPWTVAYQAPLSMGFPRQEYLSGVPLPSPEVSFEHMLNVVSHVKAVGPNTGITASEYER